MSKNAPNNPKTTESVAAPVTIEQKIAQLDTAVEWFYGDDFKLDEALAKYESAAQLATDIEKDLTELKNKVEVLEDFTKN